jgi:hypothetical protein
MAQHKPEEQSTIDQVFKLVDQLSPEGREEVLQKLKLEELCIEIQKGIDSGERGELFPAEQVFAEAKRRIAERKKEQK